MTHTTTYRYDDEVSSSYGQIQLLARGTPGQRCEKSLVAIDPPPDDYRERDDFYGNRVAYFELLSPHRQLSVRTTSWVAIDAAAREAVLASVSASVSPPSGVATGGDVAPASAVSPASGLAPGGGVAPGGGSALGGALPWEAARAAVASGKEFLLDSPLVAASADLADYARASFLPGRPIVEALADLTERVHDEFRYRPGATIVTTTAGEVLNRGEGVCQDFAHLVIGCMRSLGLPARYVSGYLETDPLKGLPRRAGADVSHAWASVLIPGSGWIDIDPTNRQFVNGRYIVAACGRDYTDVPPLKGVIFTEGNQHDLEVLVDVVRVEDDDVSASGSS